MFRKCTNAFLHAKITITHLKLYHAIHISLFKCVLFRSILHPSGYLRTVSSTDSLGHTVVVMVRAKYTSFIRCHRPSTAIIITLFHVLQKGRKNPDPRQIYGRRTILVAVNRFVRTIRTRTRMHHRPHQTTKRRMYRRIRRLPLCCRRKLLSPEARTVVAAMA